MKKFRLTLIILSVLILLGSIGMTVFLLFSNYQNVRLFKQAQSNFLRGDDASLTLAEAQLLQLVRNECDELRIGWFSFGVTDRVSKEALECIEIATIPSYLNGVANGSLHAAGRGLEGLGDLRIEDLRDGVDHIHIVYCNNDGFP